MAPKRKGADVATDTPNASAEEGNSTDTPTEGSTALAVADHEETATQVVPAHKRGAVATLEELGDLVMSDAEDDHGFAKGDVALPFYRVLQSNSPQVKRQNPKYVEGAEGGMFYNTATNQIYDGMKGIRVIPVHFQRQATLWIPRTGDGQAGPVGGGFVREIPLDEALALLKRCKKNDKKKDITPDDYTAPDGTSNKGLELVIAAMYYMIIIGEELGAFETVAYPLTSTQLKKARAWNAMITNARLPLTNGAPGTYNPAMYGFSYKLTTVPEQNASGDWMGVKIAQDLPLLKRVDGKMKEMFEGAASLYQAARDLKALVSDGKVTIKPDYDGEAGGAEGGGAEDTPLPF